MKTYQFISASEVSNYNAALIVENTQSIYSVTEWLKSCVVKILKRGGEPSFTLLAASSTISKILTMIDSELLALDCPKMTKEEREELRKWIANNIFYSTQEELS